MLSLAMNNQVGQQRGAREERVETSKIPGILEDEAPRFSCSITTKDLENFVEELRNVFDMMHKVDTERVELDTYQLKNLASRWFDLWTLGGD